MSLSNFKKFKTLLGNLDLNTIKQGLGYSKKFINIVKDIDQIGKTHNIETINKITEKLLKNKNFKKFENAIGVSEGIINAVETQKKSGLFNRNNVNINKIGIEEALRKRKSALNKSVSIDENQAAIDIVNNIK